MNQPDKYLMITDEKLYSRRIGLNINNKVRYKLFNKLIFDIPSGSGLWNKPMINIVLIITPAISTPMNRISQSLKNKIEK